MVPEATVENHCITVLKWICYVLFWRNTSQLENEKRKKKEIRRLFFSSARTGLAPPPCKGNLLAENPLNFYFFKFFALAPRFKNIAHFEKLI